MPDLIGHDKKRCLVGARHDKKDARSEPGMTGG